MSSVRFENLYIGRQGRKDINYEEWQEKEENVMAIKKEGKKTAGKDKAMKVYNVNDIQNLLGLGRSKAYEFVREVYHDKKPFQVLKIGSSYRIPSHSFDKWLNGEAESLKEMKSEDMQWKTKNEYQIVNIGCIVGEIRKDNGEY